MKKPVVLAALVCGLLGSSYAGSSYPDDSAEDNYWKSAPYENDDLDGFRSPPKPVSRGRSYSQNRELQVKSRFSGSSYSDPDEFDVGKSESFVINDQTGRRVNLSEVQKTSRGRVSRTPVQNSSFGGQSTAGRSYQQPGLRTPVSREPQHQGNTNRQHSTSKRDFARGFDQGQTPRYSGRSVDQLPVPEVKSRVFGQTPMNSQNMQAQVPEPVEEEVTQRRPRIRKNVQSQQRTRRRRGSWFSQPFQKVSQFFAGIFRR